MAALNRALLAGESATETLQLLCAARFPSVPVVAERVTGPDIPPDEAVRAILANASCRFRHVRLCCGGVVLSVAENWYVPDRLTPAMNTALDTTDEPFGRVVRPLGCRRHTLEATTLSPPGAFVLAHRAVLFDRGGAAVCVVVERYTRGVVEAAPAA